MDIPKTKEKGEAQKTYVPGTNKFKEHVVEVVDFKMKINYLNVEETSGVIKDVVVDLEHE